MASWWDNVLSLFNTGPQTAERGDFAPYTFPPTETGGGGYSTIDALGGPPAPAYTPSPTPFTPSPWAELGKEVAKAAVGPLISLSTAAIADKAFPSRTTPTQLVSTDVRTPQGKAAEEQRLTTAGETGALAQRFLADPNLGIAQNPRQVAAEEQRLGGLQSIRDEIAKALGDPYYGTLSPASQERQMNEIARQRRNADAARGMLETGGSAQREQEDLAKYREAREAERWKTIESRFGQLGPLSSGFQGPTDRGPVVASLAGTRGSLLQGMQPEQLTTFPSEEQPNPWAKLLTTAGSDLGKNIARRYV